MSVLFNEVIVMQNEILFIFSASTNIICTKTWINIQHFHRINTEIAFRFDLITFQGGFLIKYHFIKKKKKKIVAVL